MSHLIEFYKRILLKFLKDRQREGGGVIDREEVLAHATLSALAHHWPGKADAVLRALLEDTMEIKDAERSRWMVQRRIAIAKLCRALSPVLVLLLLPPPSAAQELLVTYPDRSSSMVALEKAVKLQLKDSGWVCEHAGLMEGSATLLACTLEEESKSGRKDLRTVNYLLQCSKAPGLDRKVAELLNAASKRLILIHGKNGITKLEFACK